MPLIIRGLRNEKVALGTANEAPATMVCATKKAKTATKTTRLTTTKGNFAKTTEVQEPADSEDDDEDREKPAA